MPYPPVRLGDRFLLALILAALVATAAALADLPAWLAPVVATLWAIGNLLSDLALSRHVPHDLYEDDPDGR